MLSLLKTHEKSSHIAKPEIKIIEMRPHDLGGPEHVRDTGRVAENLVQVQLRGEVKAAGVSEDGVQARWSLTRIHEQRRL